MERRRPGPDAEEVDEPCPAVPSPASAAGRAEGLRTGLAMVGVFLVAEVVLLLAALVLFAVTDPGLSEGDRLPPWPLLTLLVVPAALTAVAGTALWGGGPSAGRVRRELALRWSWNDIGTGLAFGVGGLLLTVPAAGLWAAWIGDDRAGSAVGEAFAGRQLDLAPAVAAFLVVWLVAPLAEEILFRGVLWRALEHWRWNRWGIFAVTTVAFSVAHLEFLRTPLLLVLSVPIGLTRVVTGNLPACVVAHQVNNFLPAVVLLLTTTGVW